MNQKHTSYMQSLNKKGFNQSISWAEPLWMKEGHCLVTQVDMRSKRIMQG